MAAREQGCGLVRVRAWDGADQIDAAMNPNESAVAETCGDLVTGDARRDELRMRNRSMLAARQSQDQRIR
jgi:hypothetical protein